MKGHPHPTKTMTDLYLWLGMDYQSEYTADNQVTSLIRISFYNLFLWRQMKKGLTTRVAPSYLSNKEWIQD